MLPIDIIVLSTCGLLFVLWFADMFGRPIFESPGLASCIATILCFIASLYFFSDSNPWITGACAFLAVAYAITALALKGSK